MKRLSTLPNERLAPRAIRAVRAPAPGLIWLAILMCMTFILLRAEVVQAKVAPQSFSDLADELLPSVVNISTTQVIEGNPGIEIPTVPPGSPFEDFFKEFLERSQPQQRRRRATSLGSGFIVDRDGHIVTNNHVIQDSEEIAVILHDESRVEAKVIGRDPKTDIAVLKLEDPPAAAELRPVEFGDSDRSRVGDWVIAIGNPFGFGGTVTAGIISARGRDINAGPYDDFLQTDASINRGNSGGPMFNLDGKVIGINTAIFSPSGGSIGIGFAIPANSARAVIDQLIQHGSVQRGWLGVRIQTVSDEIAETLGLTEPRGALVASVIQGGPAEAANIRPGDVILEFAGTDVDEMRKLPRIVADTEVGKPVDVVVWRDNEEVTVQVEVGSLAEGEAAMASVPAEVVDDGEGRGVDALGLSIAPVSETRRKEYGLGDDARGVVVTDVDPQGSAGEQGIKPGDLIVEVGQDPVASPQEVADKVEAAKRAGKKSILLLIEGEAGLRFVALPVKSG
jgi:serine protease Do